MYPIRCSLHYFTGALKTPNDTKSSRLDQIEYPHYFRACRSSKAYIGPRLEKYLKNPALLYYSAFKRSTLHPLYSSCGTSMVSVTEKSPCMPPFPATTVLQILCSTQHSPFSLITICYAYFIFPFNSHVIRPSTTGYHSCCLIRNANIWILHLSTTKRFAAVLYSDNYLLLVPIEGLTSEGIYYLYIHWLNPTIVSFITCTLHNWNMNSSSGSPIVNALRHLTKPRLQTSYSNSIHPTSLPNP